MVVQAGRQLTDRGKLILRGRLRDVSFHTAVDHHAFLDDAKFDLLDLDERANDEASASEVGKANGSTPLVTRLAGVDSKDEVIGLVLEEVIGCCAERVGLPRDALKTEMSIMDYGFNSLSALDLQTWITRRVSMRLKVFDILNAKSLRELARKLSRRCPYVQH